MKPSWHCSHRLVAVALAACASLGAGCGGMFVPKHKVLVDAISAPGLVKPNGQSYRLVAKTSTVQNTPMQVPVVKACIDAALTSIGMFDAPANVPPDVFIEVSYGTDSGPRVDPAARETFLQLSARANPARNLEKSTGPELWDVRVGVLGIAGRPESAMPLLASVAVKHIATDTKAETKVEIPQNEPAVASVRETAIKSLEGKAPGAIAPAAGATSAPTGRADTTPSATTPSPAPSPGTVPPAAPRLSPSVGGGTAENVSATAAR